MDLGLTDRVYVVTGGSRGLGRATAEVLVAEGARVVLAARVTGERRQRPSPRSAARRRPSGVAADLADPDAAAQLVAAGPRHASGGSTAPCSASGGPPPARSSTAATRPGARPSRPCSSASCVWLARSSRDLGEGGAWSSSCRRRCARRSRGSPSPTACGPGLAMVAKDLADEVGAARDPRERAAARPRSAPSASRSWTR